MVTLRAVPMAAGVLLGVFYFQKGENSMTAKDKELSDTAQEGIENLKSISGKLKVLYAATKSGDFDYHELVGFQDVARLTLEETIEELNGIISDLEEYQAEEIKPS